MKTKKQIEKQELKYAPGDKVVYHCAGVDREGLIAYVDDSDNVAQSIECAVCTKLDSTSRS